MTEAPSFVLSGGDGALVAQGADAAYPDIAGARAALRSGRTPILVGALPFDVGSPAALMAPRTHQFTDTLPSWPAQPGSNVRIAATVPTAEQHGVRIRRALAALRDPDNPLRKVVLARALQVSAERPWDVRTVLRHLAAADPQAYTYLADLTPAGPDHAGRTLIGASPELLVASHGDKVTCRPFAGSAPRSPDAETDRANGAALDLALALHPIPAVGGVPGDAAAAMIAELEGDRGFYGGATGWCDRHGDGRWVVSIRCAVLSADRRTAEAYSGGGIVADSEFRTILSALEAE
jgi:isochorismate synthase